MLKLHELDKGIACLEITVPRGVGDIPQQARSKMTQAFCCIRRAVRTDALLAKLVIG